MYGTFAAQVVIGILDDIVKTFGEHDVQLMPMELKQRATDGRITVQMSFRVNAPKVEAIYEAIARIEKHDATLSLDVGNGRAA